MAEYIEREKIGLTDFEIAMCNGDYKEGMKMLLDKIESIPAADVVARDCFDKILVENDDMRAIIDTYGGLENIQSAFVKLHEIETADVVPVRHGHKVTHNRPIAGHWVSGKLDDGWDEMEGRVWVPPLENNPVDYCSECGKRLDDTFQKYCPHCGARMDGDGDV